MKTFYDLVWKTHTYGNKSKIHAELNFDNGYGVSVVQGFDTYGREDNNTYELAVLKGDRICYTTPVTSDVLGWLTVEQITDAMKRVQELECKLLVENILNKKQARIEALINNKELI